MPKQPAVLSELVGVGGTEQSEVSGGGKSGQEQPAAVAAEEVQDVLVELYQPDEAARSLLLCLGHSSPEVVRWSHEAQNALSAVKMQERFVRNTRISELL